MRLAVLTFAATLALGADRTTRAIRDFDGNVKFRLVALEDGGGRIEFPDGGIYKQLSGGSEPDCVPDAGEFDRTVANGTCKSDNDCALRHSHYAGIPCCYAVSETVLKSAAYDAALTSLVEQCGYVDGICIRECARALCRKHRCTVEYAPSD